MSLLDLQAMEPETTALDAGHGGDDGDQSSASLLLCDTHSSQSVIICL
ncbi:SapB/AmfS family lanthipeptide [Streptomyces hoynatensis]|uniref:SapB/AmfS family lantipeptide n=1 Tax=Streptomyces hoynatensis TaxID=1141874 RepID=A0A3A9Z385_9ACTN|nr:SapB/AmfS family lanthipeptide [Streptomyces hoynatensis]RKN42469.1 SapB/AmfS family lantipeptide [Streptomyces hoynatensis]